jgi:hypothetical protein
VSGFHAAGLSHRPRSAKNPRYARSTCSSWR